MDEKRTDLKAALRELAAEEASDLGPHVGLKRLIAYRQGSLSAAERETLQDHLSLCQRCTERLLELRDFEAASASAAPSGDTAGPEALRDEAWESLSRRLPWQVSAVRPIAGAGRPRASRPVRFLSLLAAALLLALIGLSLWTAATVQRERDRFARLEQQWKDREATLAATQRSLAETERQLAASRARPERDAGRVQELEARIAELTAALEELRRPPQTPDRNDQLAALPKIELSTTPRFVLRGQEPAAGLLRANGAVNPVRLTQEGRLRLAVSLADHPVYGEYRFELMDRAGAVLWAGRRPGRSLLGDAGTMVSVNGLGPGLYKLRIEGLQERGSDLLAEYVLEVTRTATPAPG